jgi:carboxypeptidase family protein
MWITGEVRDDLGCVLPGVSVELSGPPLMDRTKTAVTDARGQYTIVDLRPGVYRVKFARSGFSPLQREPVDASSSFVATICASLRRRQD